MDNYLISYLAGRAPIYLPTPPPTPPPSDLPVIDDVVGTAEKIGFAVKSLNGADGVIKLRAGETRLGGVVGINNQKVLIYGPGEGDCLIHTRGENEYIGYSGKTDGIRMAGMTWNNQAPETYSKAIRIGTAFTDRHTNVRLHNMSLLGYGFVYGGIMGKGNNNGVIDHCYFENYPVTNGFGYGVVIDGDAIWLPNPDIYIGSLDMWVVEDCEFRFCRHAIAGNRGVRYAFRHNDCHDGVISHMVDAHGGYQLQCGTVLAEIYENDIYDPTDPNQSSGPANVAIGIRGGLTIIFDNRIRGYRWPVCYVVEGSNMELEEALKYKPYRSYEWNNKSDSGKGATLQFNDRTQDNLTVGKDVFFETKFPGYVPLVYPHPLTLS